MDATQKTLAVLDALAGASGGSTRLSEVADRAGLPRSTVHRILQRLVEHGYAQSEGEGRYATGTRVLALAGEALRRLDQSHMLPVLGALRDEVGHTVHFALLTGHEATYTEKLEDPDSAYQMASRVGMSLPLHSTAIGKAILAAMPAAERSELIARLELAPRTPRTFVEPDRLVAELEAIADRGFAIDEEENELTIRCVGAVVRDHKGRPVGAVSVSSLTFDLEPERALAIGPRVVAAADDLSAALGAPQPSPSAS